MPRYVRTLVGVVALIVMSYGAVHFIKQRFVNASWDEALGWYGENATVSDWEKYYRPPRSWPYEAEVTSLASTAAISRLIDSEVVELKRGEVREWLDAERIAGIPPDATHFYLVRSIRSASSERDGAVAITDEVLWVDCILPAPRSMVIQRRPIIVCFPETVQRAKRVIYSVTYGEPIKLRQMVPRCFQWLSIAGEGSFPATK